MYVHLGAYTPLAFLSLLTLFDIAKPFTGVYLEHFGSNIHPSVYLYGVWLLADVAFLEGGSANWRLFWGYTIVAWILHQY